MPKEAIHVVRKKQNQNLDLNQVSGIPGCPVVGTLCFLTAEKQGKKKKKSQIQVSPCVSSGHSSLSF